MPALGMQWTGTDACSPRKRIASRMSSGPVEQLRPITSTRSASSVVSTASIGVPSSILPPLGSSETLVWIGRVLPVSLNAARAPKIAALTSRMSCAVSMMIRSEPPWIRPVACSVKISTSSPKRILPSVGSSEAGRWPVGPIEPATKRSSPAALRAISAALVLISSVCSPRPHSSSLSREAWKVSVSSTSAPASSIERVDALDDVGAVEDEGLVALAREPAVVLLGQVVHLECGAHPAVENDDAGAHGIQVITHEIHRTATLTQLRQGWASDSVRP